MLERVALAGTVALVALFALSLAVLAYGYSRPLQPERLVTVQVVRIGLHETRWLHNAVVTFQTADGLTGEKIVRLGELSCGVGDKVQAVRQGVSVRLVSAECGRGTRAAR